MANTTIPNLTSATTIAPSTDLMVLEQTAGTRKATLSQIFTSSATSGSGLGITSGGVYTIKAGLDSDISDINTLLGSTSIASIGDGTVTGAVSQINSDLSDYTKDFETLSNLVAFTDFDIALPQDITTGSKVHILIHESSVDVWFTKELICGIDIFLSQPAKRIFNVGGYYINSNVCGSCFVQTTPNGRLQYNSIQLNGVDKSATTTIACVLFRA